MISQRIPCLISIYFLLQYEKLSSPANKNHKLDGSQLTGKSNHDYCRLVNAYSIILFFIDTTTADSDMTEEYHQISNLPININREMSTMTLQDFLDSLPKLTPVLFLIVVKTATQILSEKNKVILIFFPFL